MTNISDLVFIGAAISSYYSSNSTFSCAADSDCLNNGTCYPNNTCICTSDFWGSNCNFNRNNSNQAVVQNIQILDQLDSFTSNTSNDTEKVAVILVQITSVSETNNNVTINKTLFLISKISKRTTSSSLLVSTLSNIIDIVSDKNTSNSTQQMELVVSLVTELVNFQLTNAKINSVIEIKSNNLDIKAAKLNSSDKVDMNQTLKTVLGSSDTNSNSTKFIVNDVFLNKLAEIDSPSISVTKWTSNPYSSYSSDDSNVTSSVVSFEVKGSNQEVVNISNLTSPITIQIEKKKISSEKNVISICKYWDKSVKKWKTDGVVVIKETSTIITCSTTHLTDFGGSQIILVILDNIFIEKWYFLF